MVLWSINFPFSIEIEGFETITEVKKEIQVQQRVQEIEQKKSKRSKFFETNTESILYKRDEYEILQRLEDDNKTVYDYGIDDFIKGKFILTKTPDYEPKNYPIFVKMSDKLTITIDCYHFDTISILKGRIQENGLFIQQMRKTKRPIYKQYDSVTIRIGEAESDVEEQKAKALWNLIFRFSHL